MSKYTRVYHPSLSSWQDVPASTVKDWTEVGWLPKRPAHVDDSDTLPPAAPFVASLPVESAPVVVEPDPKPAAKQ